ncbi:hypothetical protein NA66_1008177 [Burkholderia pyrrocinia]|uniref:Uncharacterized protein n=1 Tax=Burkholderia pyrrocinia TaxID=60550 RepID=A0A318IKT9_BURPY|nr:hypothetical protein NA66_1008177 [Burkholderia pyrrocinia]SFW69932.1 hypothetical protein SAMN03159384_03983 [Burkholderia sp. NFACC33-1]SFY30617.1 hypothetical protein SAMN03159408_04049 [Burkholderia sp. NFPP32]
MLIRHSRVATRGGVRPPAQSGCEGKPAMQTLMREPAAGAVARIDACAGYDADSVIDTPVAV